MTRIAHLSDLHLLEDDLAARSLKERLRLSFLTFGRSIDAIARRARVARALQNAWEAEADHLVITGDVTEDGIESQFLVLADVLRESDWPAHRVTLVPGNHDAYAEEDAWSRAFDPGG